MKMTSRVGKHEISYSRDRYVALLLAIFAYMHENAQFAIKYCFLILRNVYSSKKCIDSEINLISLKNHDGMCRGNLRKASEHLRDYLQVQSTYCFQPTGYMMLE